MTLTKGEQTENVSATLSEKVTLSNPVFLFEFTSDTTKKSNTCIAEDVSIAGVARDRSNLFDITEGVDDRLNSSLILFNAGRYHYIIREQTSTTNLNPALSGKILERGTMELLDSQVSPFLQNEISVTYTAHEPT